MTLFWDSYPYKSSFESSQSIQIHDSWRYEHQVPKSAHNPCKPSCCQQFTGFQRPDEMVQNQTQPWLLWHQRHLQYSCKRDCFFIQMVLYPVLLMFKLFKWFKFHEIHPDARIIYETYGYSMLPFFGCAKPWVFYQSSSSSSRNRPGQIVCLGKSSVLTRCCQ